MAGRRVGKREDGHAQILDVTASLPLRSSLATRCRRRRRKRTQLVANRHCPHLATAGPFLRHFDPTTDTTMIQHSIGLRVYPVHLVFCSVALQEMPVSATVISPYPLLKSATCFHMKKKTII